MSDVPDEPAGGDAYAVVLRSINQNLARLIHREIEGRAEDGEFGVACNVLATLTPKASARCWEVKQCAKPECPSYEADDHRCWLTAGTLCGGTVQGDFAQKAESCMQCEVFQASSANELSALCEHINILVYHLQARAKQLRDEAITDPLTGLYNRRLLDELGPLELARSVREGLGLGIIAIDLDGLKAINDTFGHEAGDACLTRATTLLRRSFRRSDLLFRVGGDEFVAMLPCAAPGHLPGVLGRLATTFEDDSSSCVAESGWAVRASAGAAIATELDGLAAAFADADARMYAQKRERRG